MNIKKKFPVAVVVSLVLLASQLSASASLAIYAYKGSTITIGGNQSLSVKDTGTLVIDLLTMEAHYIGQFSTGRSSNLKNYWVSAPLENTINTQVLGPKGASYTVIAAVENPSARYYGSIANFQSAVGLNKLVTLRKTSGTETAFLPKTLTSSRFVLTDESNFDYLSQSFGTYSFNSPSTLACNNANKTISAVISELEASYRNKNFTQWPATSLVGMPAPQVSTLAGSGDVGNADGEGTSASFNYPDGVAVDGSGNIYVADTGNHRIRKITPSGYVTTLAGDGTSAFSDGQGTSASFNFPRGVAVDGNGNVYVADNANNRIRKITPSGLVTTLAGSGNVGEADGHGSEASFSYPFALAVDGNGSVYVADYSRNIRKITPSGYVTTLAEAATLDELPGGVAVDGSGNVYVTDCVLNLIRKITPSGYVTTLAGSGDSGYADGQGTLASFAFPSGAAVDANGNVYVVDTSNRRIRKITSSGYVTTLAGSGDSGYADGQGTLARFVSPTGVAVDASGNVYVLDQGNNRIRKITISQ